MESVLGFTDDDVGDDYNDADDYGEEINEDEVLSGMGGDDDEEDEEDNTV